MTPRREIISPRRVVVGRRRNGRNGHARAVPDLTETDRPRKIIIIIKIKIIGRNVSKPYAARTNTRNIPRAEDPRHGQRLSAADRRVYYCCRRGNSTGPPTTTGRDRTSAGKKKKIK